MAPALPRPRSLDATPAREPAHASVRVLPLAFPARDGYPLKGALYLRDDADASAAADVVVFNSGGGVAFCRYRHFLTWLAGEGFPVVAYDYRGVGASAPEQRRGFDAGIEDWAELDQAAAIDFTRARFPAARLTGISHSIGCLVSAAAPNADSIEQFVFVAPHTAYWGDYRQPWRLPMALIWHVLMPAVARVVGYFPAGKLGLGDDFPRRIATQWALSPANASLPAHVMASEVQDRLRYQAARVFAPALILTSESDPFTTESACARFIFHVRNVRTIRRKLEEGHFRTGLPGHWDFFSRRNRSHWIEVTHYMKAAFKPLARR